MEHSVELIKEKCIGCTDCIKRCPTEAIRVRNGKATIISEHCIDCGLCIKVCSNRAKQAITDKLDVIGNHKYNAAIPAPALYGQFKNVFNTNLILTALKQLGFDDVFEVAKGAELVTKATLEYVKGHNVKKPVISSACPAIVKLISMNYPSLLEHVLPLIPPVEAAASIVRSKLSQKYGVAKEDIGIFFISPCPAKATYAKMPIGIEKTNIDGVISIENIYKKMTTNISGIAEPEILAESGSGGIGWALTGGESSELNMPDAIAVDGIENVKTVLEEVENGQLNVDFIEALACTGGCVGGPLTVVNNFVARNNLHKLRRSMNAENTKTRETPCEAIDFTFTKELNPIESLRLHEDLSTALERMEQAEKIYESLPKIDCGSCGAPTCKALSEDIVRGVANIEDCVFMLRRKVKELAEIMLSLTAKIPQTTNGGTEMEV